MSDTESLNRDVQQTKDHAAESFGQLKDDAARIAQSAADVARGGVEQIKSKISDGHEAVRTKIADGTEAARAKFQEGTDAAREYAGRARERGNDLLEQVQTQIEQNPLQAVAIAAGVGVVIGVLLRRH